MNPEYGVTVLFPGGKRSYGKVPAVPQIGTTLNWSDIYGLTTWRVADVTICGGDDDLRISVFVESHPDFTTDRKRDATDDRLDHLGQALEGQKFHPHQPLKADAYQDGWNDALDQAYAMVKDARFDNGTAT